MLDIPLLPALAQTRCDAVQAVNFRLQVLAGCGQTDADRAASCAACSQRRSQGLPTAPSLPIFAPLR